MLREGAVGYLLKERVNRVADFERGLRIVADGGTVIDSEVTRQHLLRAGSSGLLDALTPREREVLALMADGSPNGEIASTLFSATRQCASTSATSSLGWD